MAATPEQIRDLAQAIADGTVIGPQWAVARRIKDNADTLMAWVPDDRSGY